MFCWFWCYKRRRFFFLTHNKNWSLISVIHRRCAKSGKSNQSLKKHFNWLDQLSLLTLVTFWTFTFALNVANKSNTINWSVISNEPQPFQNDDAIACQDHCGLLTELWCFFPDFFLNWLIKRWTCSLQYFNVEERKKQKSYSAGLWSIQIIDL